jgi:hypothetical protein
LEHRERPPHGHDLTDRIAAALGVDPSEFRYGRAALVTLGEPGASAGDGDLQALEEYPKLRFFLGPRWGDLSAAQRSNIVRYIELEFWTTTRLPWPSEPVSDHPEHDQAPDLTEND